MADADDLIGTAEAARILGYSQRKVQREATTGAIPIVKKLDVQRANLFRRSDIERIADGHTPTP